ncbi:hypothetical protein ES703_101872 [subsurface metagenome]
MCVINAGVYENCYSITKKENNLTFVEVQDPSFKFHLEIRPGREEILTDNQKALYKQMIQSVGVIDTGRGGNEYLYLQKNGSFSVVQPEGWLKRGGFWFDVDGHVCGDVNVQIGCMEIINVGRQKALLAIVENGKRREFEVIFDYDRDWSSVPVNPVGKR